MWDSIGGFLKNNGLTILGGVLGGPVGMAGAAAKLVAGALGCDETPEAIDAAIKADPEALVKLRTVQDNNRTVLEKALIVAGVQHHELEVAEEKARLQDVGNARAAEAERLKQGGMWANSFQNLVGCLVVGGFFWAFWTVTQASVDEMNQSAYMMVGGLIASFNQVVQYFFGSSRSSSKKDGQIAAMGHTATGMLPGKLLGALKGLGGKG